MPQNIHLMIKHTVSWTVTIPLRTAGLQPINVTKCRQISKIYSLCTWRATVRNSTYHSPVMISVLRSSNLRSANGERMMLQLLQAREYAIYTWQQRYDKRLPLQAFRYDAITVILARLQIPGLFSHVHAISDITLEFGHQRVSVVCRTRTTNMCARVRSASDA